MQWSQFNPSSTKIFVIIAILVLFIIPEIAFAQGTGGGGGGGGFLDSFTGLFDAIGELLTTVWARAIGIIAIAVTGYLFFTGRLEMRWAAAVILGIIFVFGAPAIVDSISAIV